MCGFLAKISKSKYKQNLLSKKDFEMAAQEISHRGPDSKNYCITNNGSYFSHTRLSIIDKSSNSNQPFISKDSKSILCFNGEIYNYKQLSYKYFGKEFKGDTETLSELFNT